MSKTKILFKRGEGKPTDDTTAVGEPLWETTNSILYVRGSDGSPKNINYKTGTDGINFSNNNECTNSTNTPLVTTGDYYVVKESSPFGYTSTLYPVTVLESGIEINGTSYKNELSLDSKEKQYIIWTPSSESRSFSFLDISKSAYNKLVLLINTTNICQSDHKLLINKDDADTTGFNFDIKLVYIEDDTYKYDDRYNLYKFNGNNTYNSFLLNLNTRILDTKNVEYVKDILIVNDDIKTGYSSKRGIITLEFSDLEYTQQTQS